MQAEIISSAVLSLALVFGAGLFGFFRFPRARDHALKRDSLWSHLAAQAPWSDEIAGTRATEHLPAPARQLVTLEPDTLLPFALEAFLTAERHSFPGLARIRIRQLLVPLHGAIWQIKKGPMGLLGSAELALSRRECWASGYASLLGSVSHRSMRSRQELFSLSVLQTGLWAPAALLNELVVWDVAGDDTVVAHIVWDGRNYTLTVRLDAAGRVIEATSCLAGDDGGACHLVANVRAFAPLDGRVVPAVIDVHQGVDATTWRWHLDDLRFYDAWDHGVRN